MKIYLPRFSALVCLSLALAACGGGGGGGGETAASTPSAVTPPTPPTQTLVRAALPTLVQDIEPAGVRIDLRSRNYFPLGDGDTLTYDKTKGSTVIAGAVKRTTSSISGVDPVVTEVDEGVSTNFTYRRTANGILSIDPLTNDAPVAARTLVGNVLDYPEPFFAIGAVRITVRQGGFGADLDGDGIQESFRLDIRQSFVGLETLPLPVGMAEMAHFTTTATLTISPSRQSSEVTTLITTENTWFAPGVGLVRANSVSTQPDGTVVEPFYSMTVASGVVGGATLPTPPPVPLPPVFVPDVVKVKLTHRALVYDAQRNRYYASVPNASVESSFVGQRNTIATIDPTTGSITYSAVVGNDPSQMAISGDGQAMYVGLTGTGELLKLRLPDMVELSRTRLPVDAFFGQIVATSIAASPTEPDTLAVATSSRDFGVVLLRNGVIQTRQTLNDSYNDKFLAFDTNGQFVYAFQAGTTGPYLRRIEVLPDGLIVRTELSNVPSNLPRYSLDFSAQGLVTDLSIYRSSDLALLGTVPNRFGACRAHNVSNRIICLPIPGLASTETLAVLDATSFAVVSMPIYGDSSGMSPLVIVPGPLGQVALRFSNGLNFGNGLIDQGNLWLFNHPDLK